MTSRTGKTIMIHRSPVLRLWAAGQRGWGAAGTLDLSLILKLTR